MKNLQEYKNSLICNPMSESYLFSEEDCNNIFNALINLKYIWQPRLDNNFMTVGALSYLDDGHDYISNLNKFNPLLWNYFEWVYQKIQAYYQTNFDKPVIYWVQSPFPKALPGFHIFQNSEFLNNNKWSASIHTDSPQLKHVWKSDVRDTFSFTISIQSPSCNSGLKFWMDTEIFKGISPIYYNELSENNKKELEEKFIYIPYKIGYIYEHTGDMYHQIATEGTFMSGEKRITLQGHLAEFDDTIMLYV